VSAVPRTVSPSLGSCSASGGASSFLPASALLVPANRPCDLPAAKARDASDRLLPPERYCVYPYLACSRFTSRLSPRVRSAESWAPCGIPGDRMFHDTRERFGGLQVMDTHCLCLVTALSRRGLERGSFIPTAPTAIEPLTPLSPLPRTEELRSTFVRRLASPSFERFAFHVRKPPRSS
jgi:hypothetical protein